MESQNALKETVSQTLERQNALKETVFLTLENQNALKRTVFEALESQKETLSQNMTSVLGEHTKKIHETFSIQTKTVNAVIEEQNKNIENVIENQKSLQMQRNENESQFKQIDRNFAEINASLSRKR